MESDSGETRQLLEQAIGWKRPRTHRADFEANLSAISSAKPETDDLVNDQDGNLDVRLERVVQPRVRPRNQAFTISYPPNFRSARIARGASR